MLAAIAVGEGRSSYIKLIGPQDCVDHWAASYREFMRSLVP